jgi:ferredoxin
MSSRAANARLRVRVDPIRCTAFGFCAEFCPEMFTLDEWGYAWLREPVVGPEMIETIRETARLCPRAAILVEEVDEESAPRRPKRLSLRKIERVERTGNTESREIR